MKRTYLPMILVSLLLVSCASVDLNAPLPDFKTGVDPESWVQIPAGEFYYGQFEEVMTTGSYEIMVTDVTTARYAAFLNEALQAGYINIKDDQILGFYPGDEFRSIKHEERIDAGDWIFIPLTDPSQRIKYDGTSFSSQPGYEDHPMAMVTWFGAWGFCKYYGWHLPSAIEWEKAARGTDARPFPWGHEISRGNANFYASRDPYENMNSFGSRTTPVGFYNGKKYVDYQTIASISPYGLYDMAGNVWQWTGDVYEGMHYRFMRGGSKDTYDMDLRVWVTNNATPAYYSPGVGFRCAR